MRGNQIPRIRIEPPRVSSDIQGAELLMKECGFVLDEFQRLILECWLGVDEDGKYNVFSGGISIPRQSGKNIIILARELYGLVVNGDKILHTAHQVRTTKKAFQKLAYIFEDKTKKELHSMVKKIRYGVGEESIELKNGGMIEFTSRSRQVARGYDGISLVVFDEAQEMSEEMLAAVMSTLAVSTNGNRQMLYVGTPVYPGCTGDVFKRFRAQCLSIDQEKNKHNSWHEWSLDAENINDIDLSNREIWAECNPSLNIRIPIEFIEEEYNKLSIDNFARERLGFWSKTIAEEKVEYLISSEKWDRCGTDEQKPEGKTAYGVKFSSDGSEICLSGARIYADNKVRIELIDRIPTGLGISGLASWLNERYHKASCVVIDGKNGADLLIDKIRPVWIFKNSVIKPSAQDVINSASMLLNEINEETLTWYKPQTMLRDSALSSVKRRIGSGFGFGGSDSCPIESTALALYGVRTSKRDPQRKMKIG